MNNTENKYINNTKNINNNNNINNNIKDNNNNFYLDERYTKLLKEKEFFQNRYNDCLKLFYSLQEELENYQNGIERKFQKLQNIQDGQNDLIVELRRQVEVETHQKLELFKHIKTLFEMVPLLKHKLDNKENELKILRLKNQEITLDLKILQEEKENYKEDPLITVTSIPSATT